MNRSLWVSALVLGCYMSHERPSIPEADGGCDPSTDRFECRSAPVPSNVRTRIPWNSGRSAIVIPAGTIDIDSDTGSIGAIRSGGMGDVSGIEYRQLDAIEEGGAELGVLVATDLEIASGAIVRVHGSRALVIMVDGDASIAGTISASASASAPGPAGFRGGSPETDAQGPGAAATASDTGEAIEDGGGGGGSFGGRGGDGGSLGGGAPGDVYGDVDLEPIVGGSGGGGGGYPGGSGGHGGGALQISVRGNATIDGVIESNGSGGEGGGIGEMIMTGGGGGGAGSGGAILIEAHRLVVRGTIAVHGGAGGQGSPTPDRRGTRGADGSSSTDAIAGPPGLDRAGAGGAGSGIDGRGANGGEGLEGGGGGGGAGRVRLNAGAVFTVPQGSLRPPPSATTGTFD